MLAYYIAAINIEAVYHSLVGGDYVYQPFEGICLTDTFQMYESKDMLDTLLPDQLERRKRQVELAYSSHHRVTRPIQSGREARTTTQKMLPIRRWINRIGKTYASAFEQRLHKNALYDSYIRAIRWGSDRLGEAGVMAYVTNAGWIDGNAMDGLRKVLGGRVFESVCVSSAGERREPLGETSRERRRQDSLVAVVVPRLRSPCW